MPEYLIQWMPPTTLLAMMLYGWRVLARLEDRIIASADKAHAMICENIQRLETRFDKLEVDLSKVADEVSDIKVDMAILKTYVGHLKTYVGHLKTYVGHLKTDLEHQRATT